MPFASYAAIGDVARAHRIQCHRADFVTPISAPVSQYFRSELAFSLQELPFDFTEYSTTETLIFPVLREVWKPFRNELMLWSHQAIAYDADLCGTPDYVVARRSSLGAMIFDLPYLLVIEAKKDDFMRGWGQCLAAMVAAQKLNAQSGQALFGICTNGRYWEFGRLQDDVFTHDWRPFLVHQLDELTAALHYVLSQCRDEASRHPHAA